MSGGPRILTNSATITEPTNFCRDALVREIGGRLARLVVPKLGLIKIRYHRPLPDGKIKTLTIQKKASGWYANIAVEVPDVPKVEITTAVVIDVGLGGFSRSVRVGLAQQWSEATARRWSRPVLYDFNNEIS